MRLHHHFFVVLDLVADPAARYAVEDGLHQTVEVAIDLLEGVAIAAALRIVLAAQAVQLVAYEIFVAGLAARGERDEP